MMHFPETFPVPLIHLEETESTNKYLNELCNRQCVGELTTVTADFQTSGRGQRGNSWESEAGQNLTFSFVLYPVFLQARKQFLLSQIISLAIKEELEEYAADISIKWPNDIYWKEKKICGMLIENDLTGTHISRCITGVGININQETFRSDVPNPVSLKQITGQTHDCCRILASVMKRIKDYYDRLATGKPEILSLIADHYACSLFRKEGFHRYADADGEFMARLVRVESDGRFILEDQTGTTRNYLFKEVQYILD